MIDGVQVYGIAIVVMVSIFYVNNISPVVCVPVWLTFLRIICFILCVKL